LEKNNKTLLENIDGQKIIIGKIDKNENNMDCLYIENQNSSLKISLFLGNENNKKKEVINTQNQQQKCFESKKREHSMSKAKKTKKLKYSNNLNTCGIFQSMKHGVDTSSNNVFFI